MALTYFFYTTDLLITCILSFTGGVSPPLLTYLYTYLLTLPCALPYALPYALPFYYLHIIIIIINHHGCLIPITYLYTLHTRPRYSTLPYPNPHTHLHITLI